MLGWNTLSVVVVLTIGISAVIAQTSSTVTPRPPPTMTTLKPSQGRGPDHCQKCGSDTDDASKKLNLSGASISSCNLVNGISTQGINSSLFECVCKSQFNGTYNGMKSDGIRCFDVDECKANTDWCDNLATCTNTVGGFSCECAKAKGINSIDDGKTCIDILECATKNVCGYNAGFGDFGSCKEIFGSYSCKCNSGFKNINQTKGEQGSCENIDECVDTNPCNGKHELCTDTLGSYECYCDTGYEYINSTCQDINECAVNGTNNCGAFTECVDEEGSFKCKCKAGGFRFENNSSTVCEDYDECASKNDYTCDESNKSQCINNNGSYSCGCDPGYFNVTGDCKDINECAADNSCTNHTDCTNTDGSYFCTCKVGFIGDGLKNCSDINECRSGYNNTCDDKAKCSNTIGNYTCQCISGYTGDGTNCTELVTLEDLLANHTETGRDRYRSLIEHEELVKTQLLIEGRILDRRCDEKNLKRPKRQVIFPSRFSIKDGDQRFALEKLKQENSVLRLENQGKMRDCDITANGKSYYPIGK